MELQGFEPWSGQDADILSTSLVFYLLSRDKPSKKLNYLFRILVVYDLRRKEKPKQKDPKL